ncbi:MAG TPA: enoyl-CoA hydratase/isomerase family protein [Acidobacteria bacterium]|nr:enoyl-CoA hydratase/isomerase family protein [Acidobacteriota bacterium]
MRVERWSWEGPAGPNLRGLAPLLAEPGLVIVRFGERDGGGDGVPRRALEVWTASRAVTVAVIGEAGLAGPSLGVALCADLVYLVAGAGLELPAGAAVPQPALLLAARRAGPRAFRRIVLGEGVIGAEEAVKLGLAHAVVAGEEELPLPVAGSLAALTAGRDLLRSGASGTGALALESAAFRLVFAGGDPNEGARAFLERRPPDFGAKDEIDRS